MIPLAVLLAVVAAPSVFAQTDAVVSYADGSGFIVVSDGRRTEFDIGVDEVIGLPLRAGDMILTDEGSFLELTLPSGSGGVVKIAENTTFTITSLDDGGGGVFKVTYGRIRVKVAALAASSRLWVTGHDTVAGVRGTDFGYDLFYDRAVEGGERQTAVYCFDGEVDVIRYGREVESKTDLLDSEAFVLGAGKMVKTKSSTPDQKLRSSSIDDSILEYWQAYPFVTPGVPLLTDEESLEISDDLDLAVDLDSERGRYVYSGKALFATGIGLMTVGGIVRAVLPDEYAPVALGLISVGGVSLATGGGLMIYSLTLP